MNLLIVDDEPLALQDILNGVQWEKLNFRQVYTARDYEQAVDVLEKRNVSILLTDIELGNRSGLDLIQWANEHTPHTKCIVLSCHDEFDFAQRAVRMECLDYVLKPVPSDELTKVLLWAQERFCTEQESYRLEHEKAAGTVAITAKRDDSTRAVVAYIQEHIAEELLVEDIARIVHISPRHLNRLFQGNYGMPVSEFVTRQRMELAGSLLRDHYASVSQVSERVGYSNYSYFIKLFKKHYGITPGEYQKRYGK